MEHHSFSNKLFCVSNSGLLLNSFLRRAKDLPSLSVELDSPLGGICPILHYRDEGKKDRHGWMELFYILIVVFVTQMYTCYKIAENYAQIPIYKYKIYEIWINSMDFNNVDFDIIRYLCKLLTMREIWWMVYMILFYIFLLLPVNL